MLPLVLAVKVSAGIVNEATPLALSVTAEDVYPGAESVTVPVGVPPVSVALKVTVTGRG